MIVIIRFMLYLGSILYSLQNLSITCTKVGPISKIHRFWHARSFRGFLFAWNISGDRWILFSFSYSFSFLSFSYVVQLEDWSLVVSMERGRCLFFSFFHERLPMSFTNTTTDWSFIVCGEEDKLSLNWLVHTFLLYFTTLMSLLHVKLNNASLSNCVTSPQLSCVHPARLWIFWGFRAILSWRSATMGLTYWIFKPLKPFQCMRYLQILP